MLWNQIEFNALSGIIFSRMDSFGFNTDIVANEFETNV